MKTNCIVTGGSPDLAGPVVVLFESMRQFSPKLFDASDKYFYTTDAVDDADHSKLSALGVEVAALSTKAIDHKNKYTRYFTSGILSKFEVFRLSQKYDRAIWFDCDQICIRELYEVVQFDYGAAAICISHGGASSIKSNFHYESLPSQAKETYDFNVDQICGNFYIVNTDLSETYDWLRSSYYELGEHLKLVDQGVLCFMFQHFNLQVHYLENAAFTPHPNDWPLIKLLKTEHMHRPFLVHCYGQPKYWDGYEYPLWEELRRASLGAGMPKREDQKRPSPFNRMSRNLRRHIKEYARLIVPKRKA